jgi:hypothetical protein
MTRSETTLHGMVFCDNLANSLIVPDMVLSHILTRIL